MGSERERIIPSSIGCGFGCGRNDIACGPELVRDVMKVCGRMHGLVLKLDLCSDLRW
jgi:hypothetical protein